MLVTMMRCKLHGARVTLCDLEYEGSVSIDVTLLQRSGILIGEQVHIWNISNGARIVTYVIPADADSGEIGVNGAAARHFQKGDKVIIACFAQLTLEEAKDLKPSIVIIGEDNKPAA